MNLIARINEAIVVVALLINIALTFANTAVRSITGQDMAWVSEVATILIAAIAFAGAPAYFRRSHGVAYTAVLDMLHGRTKDFVEATGHWMTLGVCALSLSIFPGFFEKQTHHNFPVLGVSGAYHSGWLGLGLILLTVYCIEKMLRQTKQSLAMGLLAGIFVAGLAMLLRHSYAVGWVEKDPFLFIIPLLVATFLTGAPIAIVLALGGILYFVTTGDAPLVAIAAAYQAGVSSYILLAVPFFMLAGTLMEVTGMAGRLVAWVREWIGHWTGGLLIAEVVAMYIFSGVSGSKNADSA